MESNEKTVVLDEVEILLKKLKDLPDDLKQVAFDKIQAHLRPSTSKTVVSSSGSQENSAVTEETLEGNNECTLADPGTFDVPKRKQKTTADNVSKGTNVKENNSISKQQPKPVQSTKVIAVKEPIITRKKSREYDLAARLVEVSMEEGSNLPEHSVQKATEVQKYGKLPQLSDYIIKIESLEGDLEVDAIETTEKGVKNKRPVKEESADRSDSQAEPVNDKENASDEDDSPKPAKRRGRPSKHNRNGKLFCKECNFETSRPSQLEIHKRKHSGFKPYACPECGKAFPHSSGLNVHIKRHRGQRDYPCELCDYRAYTKIDKTRHMTVHTGERNHVCEYCGKAFAKDSTLREHVKSIHERKEKYVCEECGFQTFRANNLRVHIRMVHRGEFDNHICPVCNAHVKQRSAFLEHMRAHTGERPFKCNLCSSSFACPARLNVHVNSVHAPRSFPCDQCSKVFQTKHHLLRHQIIHTNDRPFSCPFCTYACNTQGNMSKHVRAVHHKPDFSFRKHKIAMNLTKKSQNATKKVATAVPVKAEQDESSTELEGNDEDWVRKGQRVTQEYLDTLSAKLGKRITLEELQAKEEEKKKRIVMEQYQARLKRINRIATPEHSYYNKNNPDKLDESKKRSKGAKSKIYEDEDVEMCDDPGVEGIVTSDDPNRTATIVVGTVDGQTIPVTSSSVIHLNTGVESNVVRHVSNSNPTYQTVYLPSGMVMAGGGQLYRIVTSDGGEIQLSSAQAEEVASRTEVLFEGHEEESSEPTVVVIINTDENVET